jgi:oxygen-independent coproporphyrinogen-3 oxidase
MTRDNGPRTTDEGPWTTDDKPWLRPRAAYVHVPFCAHHCGYCDFAIAVGRSETRDLYVEAVSVELATLGEPQPVRTLFVGGGTPTELTAEQLHRLLAAMRRWLPPLPGHEWSVEANPESFDDDRAAVLADAGVTRLSLGAQSFDPAALAVLERRHDPGLVERAVRRARRLGLQVSLDLIFGVPGQTPAAWRADLTRALALGPDHVSTYGLTYEKGTPLWRRRRRGAVVPLSEEAELELYRIAIAELTAAGFEQYEVSNFARPGRRCRHNETYWANEAYFGFGMGAARYVRGRRELNTRDLRAYVRKVLSGEPATFQSEELGPEERARETIAVQLRRLDGIDRTAFHAQTGFGLDALVGDELGRLVALGLLKDDGRRVALTPEGLYVADAVVERFL